MKKRLIVTLLLALCAVGCTLGLSACFTDGGEHKHTYSERTVEADCVNGGYTEYSCSCGYSFKDNITQPLGHDFDAEFTIDKEPDCTEKGVKSKHCSRCEKISEETEIDALGHDFAAEFTIDKEPDCTEKGVKSKHCSRCEEVSDKTEIDALGHDFADEFTIDKEPDCTEKGTKSKHCSRCEEVSEKTEIGALGHDLSEYKYNEREHSRECLRYGCNYTESEVHTSNLCSVCRFIKTGTEGLEYEQINDGASYRVKGIGTATDKNLLIPSYYNSLPVTEIGQEAFRNCRSLTDIKIGIGVTEIGMRAFDGCRSLMSVTIPESVEYIYDSAFSGCQSITISCVAAEKPNGWSINWNSFYYPVIWNCNNNNRDNNGYVYTVFDGIKYSLKDGNAIVIKQPVNLTAANISSAVTFGDETYTAVKIVDSAFSDCLSLSEITIPDSVTDIGVNAFYGCDSLKSISVSDNNADYASSDGILYNKETTRFIHVPKAIRGAVTIPERITEINSDTFRGCQYVTGITIPDGVTSIAASAFYNCINLQFNEYDNALYLGNDNNKFIALIDTKNTSVTSCAINENTKIIADGAFALCDSITEITVPEGVTHIGDNAFYECGSLTTLSIPDSLISIGDTLFVRCYSLEYISVGENNSNYASQDGILYNKEKTQTISTPMALKGAVTIPEGVTELGSFSQNGFITSIDIPGSVKSINNLQFKNCTSLESVTIKNGLTSIGEQAFAGCESLKSISIPDSVTSIGILAFHGCTALTDVTIGNGLTSIGRDAFYLCSNLKFNEYDNGCYLGNDVNKYMVLMRAKNGFVPIETCIVHQDAKIIYQAAFSDRTTLKSITIPEGVISIGAHAFSGCSSLTDLTIPKSVTTIGDEAFKDCSSLERINIPKSVTDIGNGAFYGCNSLKEITVDSENEKYHGSGNCLIETESKTLIVGCLGSLIPDDGSVTAIGNGAFFGCSNLESIIIPDGVTVIEGAAFFNCSNLESVTIPDSVTNLRLESFCDCSSLVNIIFKGTIEQWNAIEKEYNWDYQTGNYTIHCTDGVIVKA